MHNLSVHKAYKNQSSCISQYFSMLFLLNEGNVLGFFSQANSENLAPCNSGDSRKVAVLENDGA